MVLAINEAFNHVRNPVEALLSTSCENSMARTPVVRFSRKRIVHVSILPSIDYSNLHRGQWNLMATIHDAVDVFNVD